jgi:hypothetical protein
MYKRRVQIYQQSSKSYQVSMSEVSVSFVLSLSSSHAFFTSTTLSAKRNRRLDKSTIQAVSEQIEYLQENTRGKQMVVRLDENSRLFVDRWVSMSTIYRVTPLKFIACHARTFAETTGLKTYLHNGHQTQKQIQLSKEEKN